MHVLLAQRFTEAFDIYKKLWKTNYWIWLFCASPGITQPDILNRNQVTVCRWHKVERGETERSAQASPGRCAPSSHPYNLLTMPRGWWALQPIIALTTSPSTCQFPVQTTGQRCPFPWVWGVAFAPYQFNLPGKSWLSGLLIWLPGRQLVCYHLWKNNGVERGILHLHISICLWANLGKLQEMVRDREAWRAAVHGGWQESDTTCDWTTINLCIGLA